MFDNYRARLRAARTRSRTLELPSLSYPICAVLGLTSVYIVLAAVLGHPPEDQFRDERGVITALSSLFLSAASAFSLAAALTFHRADRGHAWVWVVLAIGLAFLSLDELVQIHERIGALLDRRLDSGAFRRWNDIVVIAYGFVALGLLLPMLPGLLESPRVTELFAVAALLYAAHTLIDSISEPKTTVSVIVEESCKVLCGAFLFLGSLTGFLGASWNTVVPSGARAARRST